LQKKRITIVTHSARQSESDAEARAREQIAIRLENAALEYGGNDWQVSLTAGKWEELCMLLREAAAALRSEWQVHCPWCQQTVATHLCVKCHRLRDGKNWCAGGGASLVERQIKENSNRQYPAGAVSRPGPE
jgi:hypothetical protein